MHVSEAAKGRICGIVVTAGGGEVRIQVARDTAEYPRTGSDVELIILEPEASVVDAAREFRMALQFQGPMFKMAMKEAPKLQIAMGRLWGALDREPD